MKEGEETLRIPRCLLKNRTVGFYNATKNTRKGDRCSFKKDGPRN